MLLEYIQYYLTKNYIIFMILYMDYKQNCDFTETENMIYMLN